MNSCVISDNSNVWSIGRLSLLFAVSTNCKSWWLVYLRVWWALICMLLIGRTPVDLNRRGFPPERLWFSFLSGCSEGLQMWGHFQPQYVASRADVGICAQCNPVLFASYRVCLAQVYLFIYFFWEGARRSLDIGLPSLRLSRKQRQQASPLGTSVFSIAGTEVQIHIFL